MLSWRPGRLFSHDVLGIGTLAWAFFLSRDPKINFAADDRWRALLFFVGSELFPAAIFVIKYLGIPSINNPAGLLAGRRPESRSGRFCTGDVSRIPFLLSNWHFARPYGFPIGSATLCARLGG